MKALYLQCGTSRQAHHQAMERLRRQLGKELHLYLIAQVADFVQKDGAPVDQFNLAGLLPTAPVKDPFTCPNSSLAARIWVIEKNYNLRFYPPYTKEGNKSCFLLPFE